MNNNNDTKLVLTVPWRSFSEDGRLLLLTQLLKHARGNLGALGYEIDSVPSGKVADFANMIDGSLSFAHNLPAALARLHRVIAIEADRTKFMRRDASLEMMLQMFRMSRREYSEMRRNLRLASSRGRPQAVAHEDRYEIAARWDAIREEEPSLLRSYLKLAEAYPEYKLSTLHALVKKL